MNYTQLTQEQRYQIAVLKKAGHMQVDIAQLIGVHKSTISREVSRNKGQRGYRPKQAHRLALERRQLKAKSIITAEEWLRIEALLRQEWSPEEIGARLRLEGRRFVSHEWIYQYVYADKKNGGDLGFFPRGRMVKAFDDAVFSMPQGTISNLVRTPFGFHIIKLEAIRPGRVRPFDEVKDELAKIMKEEEAKGLAFKKSSAAYEGIMRAGSIDKYSKQENVSVIQTDYFSRSRPSADIVIDPAFLQAAFKLGKGIEIERDPSLLLIILGGFFLFV